MHLCFGGMGDRVAAELNVRTAQGKRSEEMVDHFRGPGGGGWSISVLSYNEETQCIAQSVVLFLDLK